jgi:hypothetical protein
MGVPDACYYGCPTNNFREMEEQARAVEAATVAAQEAGDRQASGQALRDHGDMLKRIGNSICNIPDNADGPWRAVAPEGTPQEITARLQGQRCCRFAGVVVIAPGKNLPTVTVDRPK